MLKSGAWSWVRRPRSAPDKRSGRRRVRQQQLHCVARRFGSAMARCHQPRRLAVVSSPTLAMLSEPLVSAQTASVWNFAKRSLRPNQWLWCRARWLYRARRDAKCGRPIGAVQTRPAVPSSGRPASPLSAPLLFCQSWTLARYALVSSIRPRRSPPSSSFPSLRRRHSIEPFFSLGAGDVCRFRNRPSSRCASCARPLGRGPNGSAGGSTPAIYPVQIR